LVRTTIVSPGAVRTELLDHISDQDVQSANKDYVGPDLQPTSVSRSLATTFATRAGAQVSPVICGDNTREGARQIIELDTELASSRIEQLKAE
jgi:NADP-dependent 3-hydroxy acid dehydrogenase YdfG